MKPVVTGFGYTFDPKIPDTLVQEFLHTAIGSKLLEALMIIGVHKHDLIMVHLPSALSSTLRLRALQYVADTQQYTKHLAYENLIYCRTRSAYEDLAVILEEAHDQSMLVHDFKVRAHAGGYGEPTSIELGSFCIEDHEKYAYLPGATESLGSYRMRAFMLGTILHEVGHRLWRMSVSETFKEAYDSSVGIEMPREGNGLFVTPYVDTHSKRFKTDAPTLCAEDFAEGLRLYCTNPDYLQWMFPKRFSHISTALPDIPAGSIPRFLNDYDRVFE